MSMGAASLAGSVQAAKKRLDSTKRPGKGVDNFMFLGFGDGIIRRRYPLFPSTADLF
jgi:hypothetical protein